ncbi:ferredoxin [Frankia sp. CNm7]|uniref:Ferredoxin n=1 Tax=Frankia nepalensis TaxID=1836974 RepID=A0A937RWG4_9ACTN|nr:ferredoxin [Frankia nepalensis]MBL7494991.1 ferredoxin [Frankia nepalensis]MBL7514668.1 ferredoxin [Frankia nepalensis]MBL7521861.1 ferredoxin [Frankia nepalensis]MBL7633101.1 ferredoxin [Frankia nepalensis]
MPGAGTATVTIDQSRCVGSGMCVVYAPATFDHDETAKVVVIDPHGDPLEVVESAVDACPTGALSIATADSPTPQKDEA